ncbi:MAG: hypothetical protein HY209_05995 [Candidatus Omnitrophica bacterium]|nr:hypothetical protein [Candidatus Omnitrophota bacterium]
MHRIGLAASKIAKGNIWVYHLTVVVIACLFALFVFLICGFSIAVTLFVLFLLVERFLPSGTHEIWIDVLKTCLAFLGILISLFTLVAIIKNTKLKFKL